MNTHITEESRHQAGIGTCSLALQIGFFFDGLKRNINVDEDSQRLTNIGRLFRAHALEIKASLTSSYSYAKIYIPGLGTPLEDTPSERLDSIMDARQKALPEDYADALVEQGKEAAVDTVNGADLVKFFNETKRVPHAADIFFNYFMHDFASEELRFATLKDQAGTVLRNNNFFVPRGIEAVAADDDAAA
ncbi:hypothetical protein [Pectobacterium odoriferum]|uniref:hypothetical protein n=1 Tax=Pectobacterium odoriferum TaxID=78398 RepID=UPI00052A42FC|nr:hypothetical protein [Pectobacterium odoriferum]AIU87234.1 hypothetical protein BCS7_02770 [Pectobacterium odoriferum]